MSHPRRMKKCRGMMSPPRRGVISFLWFINIRNIQKWKHFFWVMVLKIILSASTPVSAMPVTRLTEMPVWRVLMGPLRSTVGTTSVHHVPSIRPLPRQAFCSYSVSVTQATRGRTGVCVLSARPTIMRLKPCVCLVRRTVPLPPPVTPSPTASAMRGMPGRTGRRGDGFHIGYI